MNEQFTRQIQEFERRVDSLRRQRQGQTAENAAATFMELQVAIEELRAAEDELRDQAENLKTSQATLEVERARYRDLFEFAPDGYLVTSRTGQILEANRIAAQMLGISPEFLAGKPFPRFFSEADQLTIRRELLQLHQTFRPGEWTARITPRGGLPSFMASVRVSAMVDIDNRLAAILWAVRDISRQHDLEMQIRSVNEQLEERVAHRTHDLHDTLKQRDEALAREAAARRHADESNRAKDHFFALLSHELRTPLTPILGLVSDMLSNPDCPPAFKKDLQSIRHSVEIESRLIADLLDITRASKGKLELDRTPLDIHPLIQSVVEVCRPDLTEKKIDLRLKLAATDSAVSGDQARLHQALWNLLKNAAKFTPSAGSITLATKNDDGRLLISLADSGIGFPPEFADRIFDAFEQTDLNITRKYGGLGLGLTIAKAVAAAHGGSLHAHSDGQGKGATFVLALPLLPEPAKSPAAAPHKKPSNGHNKPTSALKILLVDDHRETLAVMTKILKSKGHFVTAAATLAEALAFARDLGPFDLLISDIQLPDGTGVDLLHQLPARPSRAFVLSGDGSPDDRRKSRQAGFDRHLTKPLDFQKLSDIL